MLIVHLLLFCAASQLINSSPIKTRQTLGACLDPLGGRRKVGEEWQYDRKFARRCVETKNGWRIETFACILPNGEWVKIGESRNGANCERDEYGVTKLSLPFTLKCGSRENGEQWDEEEFRKECHYGTIKPVGCYTRYRHLIPANGVWVEKNVTYKCILTSKGLAMSSDSVMRSQ
ncbi:unnamed protein product [Bursaphelenchus okinawaensis]|uniref:Abnormal cell migration protein 18-like fibronectin type I domain-containing protein n=1 Tax=Bursaphelenchus okinawaensis TaxID=465554 RepID=A0A811L7D2_9BILA|nr:unnamed protein product [Bursaphelenchus okinawaensis]CAG9119428.1 unnamed protein product [Bursaphelenchus okinawaensis]